MMKRTSPLSCGEWKKLQVSQLFTRPGDDLKYCENYLRHGCGHATMHPLGLYYPINLITS